MPVHGKFEVHGGRAGLITFREGASTGELEWEGLMGEISIVIYGNRCCWTAPERTVMQGEDVRRLAQEIADEMNTKIELALSDGSEVLGPAQR